MNKLSPNNLVFCWRRLSPVLSRTCTRSLRGYVTSKGYPPVLNQQKAQTRFGNSQTVGPFMLGNVQSYGGEKVKNWKDLSPSGKVARTTARTTNLFVILLGAGLSALLVYALTTELYAESSPTVLYADACNMIEDSEEIRRYLRGNLRFYNNPPVEGRPQHRSRGVVHHIMVDSRGVEHMYINFFINSTPTANTKFWEAPHLQRFLDWCAEAFSKREQISMAAVQQHIRQQFSVLTETLTNTFHILTNQRVDSPPTDRPPLSKPIEVPETSESRWGTGGMFGMFEGLRRRRTAVREGQGKEQGSRDWRDGEVHADLIRTPDGKFRWRYLLVDIPSSQHPNPRRVFIRKAPDVRNSESVVLWR